MKEEFLHIFWRSIINRRNNKCLKQIDHKVTATAFLLKAIAIAQRNQVSSQIMDDVKNYISAKDDNERCSRAVELLARCTAVDSTGSAPINSVPASSVASTKTP